MCSDAFDYYSKDIEEEALMVAWLKDNKVLQQSLSAGFLHVPQYSTKVEELVQAVVIRQRKLSLEDVEAIWNSQVGQHDAVVTNVHKMLTKLAWSFDTEQLKHMLECFKKSWGGTKKVGLQLHSCWFSPPDYDESP